MKKYYPASLPPNVSAVPPVYLCSDADEVIDGMGAEYNRKLAEKDKEIASLKECVGNWMIRSDLQHEEMARIIYSAEHNCAARDKTIEGRDKTISDLIVLVMDQAIGWPRTGSQEALVRLEEIQRDSILGPHSDPPATAAPYQDGPMTEKRGSLGMAD